MLALLIMAVSLAASPPTPAASPAPASYGPLKEIIRVHSTSLCTEFEMHVNSAIASATRNDQSLAGLVNSLQQPKMGEDLSDNGLRRHRAIVALTTYADALTADWKSGENEVALLRDLAKKTPDPDQKVEIKASADALGGVLWRQRKIARDLDGFIAYLYAEEMRWGDHIQYQSSAALEETTTNDPLLDERERLQQDDTGGLNPSIWTPNPGDAFAAPSDKVLTASAAADFQKMLPDIQTDETTAASHLVKADSSC